jgi:hypothetical protein
MNRILPSFFLSAVMSVFGMSNFAQAPAKAFKTIASPNPVFPAEAKSNIYGDSVKVAVDVNKDGKVTATRAFGPLTPCSNLKDPAVETIQKAARDAARKTVFEPIIENGKPVEKAFMITYRLPRQASVPENEKQTIVGGVVNGKAISLPKPSYPRAARANRVGGTIQVQILIEENGRVMSAGPVSGHPDLIEGGIEAACGSRFSPTLLAGHAVKVMGIIVYNFVP